MLWHKCQVDHVLSGETPWPTKSPPQPVASGTEDQNSTDHLTCGAKHKFFTLNQQCDIPKIPIPMLPRDHTKHHTSWRLAQIGYYWKKSKSNKLSDSMFPFLGKSSNICSIRSVWQLLQIRSVWQLLQKGAQVRRLCHEGNVSQKVLPNQLLFLTWRGKRARTNKGTVPVLPKGQNKLPFKAPEMQRLCKRHARKTVTRPTADIYREPRRIGSWELSLYFAKKQ